MKNFSLIANKIYLRRKRTGKSLEDGLAREIAREMGMKVQDVKDELLATQLMDRLEAELSSRVSRVEDAMWARAEEGDFQAGKFMLEAMNPERYDAGVRRQRIANEGLRPQVNWDPNNVSMTDVIENDPLLIEDKSEEADPNKEG